MGGTSQSLRWTCTKVAWLFLAIAVVDISESRSQPVQFVSSDIGTRETLSWRREENGVRILTISAPQTPTKPAQRSLILFATPNGNTIEQTMGCKLREGVDWRFDIQHIAAQFRALQSLDATREYGLAVVQAPQLSWPEFRRTTPNANQWIRELVVSLQQQTESKEVILSCHSGGGSFLWGWMNAHDRLPDDVSRIVFLDANYSYSDEDRHGDKILEWMHSQAHQFVIIAYDDREITLNGKKVIDDGGGTFRATERMKRRFVKDHKLDHRLAGDFQITESLDRRIQFIVHANPENRILHTSLVGDMNGFLFGMLAGTPMERDVQLGGPRAYESLVAADPVIDPLRSGARILAELTTRQLRLPARPDDAETGSQFIARVGAMERGLREIEIRRAVLAGNVPAKARTLVPIQVSALGIDQQKHVATFFVGADYMSIGSDADSVRMPMTPATCMAIGKFLGCSLVTPKISDDVFEASTIRLSPKPLTQNRETPATFLQHHQLIESQLQALAADADSSRRQQIVSPIVGIKKDIVISRKLLEKPNRVAIYGWHYPDGRPIQGVYAGHVDWYTDYSHGLRLIDEVISIDGKECKLSDAIFDPVLHPLVSNEGPLDLRSIRDAAGW